MSAAVKSIEMQASWRRPTVSPHLASQSHAGVQSGNLFGGGFGSMGLGGAASSSAPAASASPFGKGLSLGAISAPAAASPFGAPQSDAWLRR